MLLFRPGLLFAISVSLLVEVASSTKGGLAMTMAGNLLSKIQLCTARKIIHTHPRDSDTSLLPTQPMQKKCKKKLFFILFAAMSR
jgi:hypothetical protein